MKLINIYVTENTHKERKYMKVKEKLSGFFEKFKGVASKIGKKNFILIGAVLLIGLAVYLNILFFGNPVDDIGYGDNNMPDNYTDVNAGTGEEETGTGSEYFASTQINRQRARDEAMEVLQTVVDSPDALQTTKDQAMSDISRIALDIEQESNIETLVMSKGFTQCVAVVNGTDVNVVVKSEGLLPSELAQIYEIVYEQTGVIPDNVKVIERKA
jgi:stage III sporulation protein AH